MSSKIKIIGEIGSNHMNDFGTGKQIIDLCKETGCELAKFQLFRADNFKWHKEYNRMKKLELSFDLAKKFFDYGEEVGIDVFFSVFYPEAITFCEEIGVKYYKISNAFSVNKEIVGECLGTGRPVFVSFSEYYDIDENLLKNPNVIPLYTIPKYPPDYKNFNLDFLKKMINRGGGYSNHYTDLFFPLLSAYLGSKWIELHVKLDKVCEASPDVVCSLTPKQLEEFMLIKNKF